MSDTVKIVFLIGNGFDIQVMEQLGLPTTTYSDFYNFIKWKYSDQIKKNVIVNKMEEDKFSGTVNWSDFENSIKNLLRDEYQSRLNSESQNFDEGTYIQDLSQLQTYFSDFLNTIVTNDVLKFVDDLGKVTGQYKDKNINQSLPLNTLRAFLHDLSATERENLLVKDEIYHHQLLDYTFFNFNYTPLFDNYITLDKESFDPHVYKQSENNFHFQFAQQDSRTDYFTKLKTRIFHPHGFQHTPRSMLFGFDNPRQVIDDYKEDLYTNSNVQKYLEEADLFVIFGHSIGESDQYWWENIYQRLKQGKADVIIYNHTSSDTEETKNKVKHAFMEAAGNSLNKENIEVLDRIFVVNSNNKEPRYAFNVEHENMKIL